MHLTRVPRLGSRAARAAVAGIVGAEVVAGVIALVVVSGSSGASTTGSRAGAAHSTIAASGAPAPSSLGGSLGASPGGSPGGSTGSVQGPGRGSSPAARTTSAATTAAQVSALVAWMRRALPPATPVLADARTRSALRSAGFTTVLGPDDPAGARFLLDSPALAAAARTRPALATVLARSVPVAAAGADPAAVSVRQVTTVTAARLAAEAATRRSAENELLANANLTVSPAARGVLRSGGLDLRAAAVLALVASTEPVTLVAVPADPFEAAAGRPARVIEIRAGSASGLRGMLLAVAPPYRVASVSTAPGGAQQLRWPVDVTSGGTT